MTGERDVVFARMNLKPGSPQYDAYYEGKSQRKVDTERCYARWRELGTDCGICLAACPLSTSVPVDLVDRMKESENARTEIMERFHAEHGNRAFNRKRVPWLE